MLWVVLNWFNISFIFIIIAISVGGRVWYWLDDNDDDFKNYILYGIAKEISKLDGTDAKNTYTLEASLIIWLGVVCLTYIIGVIIEAFIENPIFATLVVSTPLVLFATRYVIRLNKKVDKL